MSCVQALFDSGCARCCIGRLSLVCSDSSLASHCSCNSTLTVHHELQELFMLTPTENTALSLRLKYLTLHAERAHLRAKSGADVVVADVHEAGRMESPRQQSVVIYIRQLLDEINEPWGPSSLIQKGIGGAGEAVVWLARKFAQMGYFTEVYGNVPEADLGFDDGGVMWRQFWEYDERTRCDVFVVWWDHLDSVAIGAAAKARYVWLHYGQYIDRWPPVAAASIDAVFPMSRFHAQQLPEHAQDKVVVSANGLAPHLYEDGPNDTWNLIYASHPFYGLDTLLNMWPAMAAALPNATLHVCVTAPISRACSAPNSPRSLQILRLHPRHRPLSQSHARRRRVQEENNGRAGAGPAHRLPRHGRRPRFGARCRGRRVLRLPLHHSGNIVDLSHACASHGRHSHHLAPHQQRAARNCGYL